MESISVSQLRRNLRRWRTIASDTNAVIEVTYHGYRVGFFVSMEQVNSLPITVSEGYTIECFRDNLGSIHKKLRGSVLDAIFLCEWAVDRNRRVAALVAPSFANQLEVDAGDQER